MTILVMRTGVTESSHSNPGPPYQCSFSEMRDQCSLITYSLDYEGQKDDKHDADSRLSCSLSGHESNRFCATFKSLTIFGGEDGYYLANSRSNVYGKPVNPLSL